MIHSKHFFNWPKFSPILLATVLSSLSVLNQSCTKSPTETDPSLTNTILIGEVSSMTGAEATYGLSAHQGIELAIREVNESGGVRGKILKDILIDSQGKPDESTRAISRLISHDRVSAVLGGTISSNALAMGPIAQKNKIPFLATIATHPKVTDAGDHVFRVCMMDSLQGKIMARFALDHLKLKHVAILRDVKSDYSIGLAETFTSVLQAGGGEILMSQTYSAGDIDFKAQLTAIRGKKPEAIYLPGYYTDVSLIARQARELGMNIPLMGGDGWDSPKLKEIGGDAMSGSYFSAFYSPSAPSPRLQNFLESYKRTYHNTPDGLAVMGYEGVQVLVDAIQRAKSLDSVGIRDALAEPVEVQTVTGKVSMDAKRNAVRSAVILMVEKDGSAKYQATIEP